jgi:hypothetical protein
VFTKKHLDAVAWQLNTSPRKNIGWKCPAEMFTPEVFDFKQHHASLFALAHRNRLLQKKTATAIKYCDAIKKNVNHLFI